VIDDGFAAEATKVFADHLEEEFEAAKSYKSNEADWFAGRWSGCNKPADPKPRAAT
jgi:2-oxoglutarate dehydrogenase E1 component